ncbi:MAG: amidase [Haloferacaceae archaeon]
MRDVIRDVAGADVRRLAERFGIEVGEADVEGLTERVNDRLADGLDGVYEVPVASSPADAGERRWSEATDEYNALSATCHVPPRSDAGDLLDGTTVGLKDIIAVAGVPMGCASGAMHGFVPSADAAVTERLRAAGATITAKTNLDEFAGGGRGKSFRGLIRNPDDEDRIAGGSSGGSAAAVAAGLVDVALGTDTGGSVRKPATFCRLVGLKPTYGLVSLTGVIENTYTLDHVGPIADSVVDAARVLEAVAGRDERDPASMAAAGRDRYRVGGYVDAARSPPPVEDLHLAVATQGVEDDIDETVTRRHRAALDRIEAAGATLERVAIPHLDATKHLKNVLSYVELAAYWRDGGAPVRRGGVVDDFDQVGFARRARTGSAEVNDFYRSRLLAGARLLEANDGRHYTRAHAARRALRDELTDRLDGVDAILTPTSPYLAPTVERVTDPEFDPDGLDREFGYGRYSKVGNVTGLPSLTVPNESEDGPAVGLQLVGGPFEEATLLAAAERIEATVAG